MKMWISYDEVHWDEVKSIKEMLDICYKNGNRELMFKLQDSENEYITVSSDDIFVTMLKKETEEN